jgi:hypothetical protein
LHNKSSVIIKTWDLVKTMFFNQSSMADVIFRVEGKSSMADVIFRVEGKSSMADVIFWVEGKNK